MFLTFAKTENRHNMPLLNNPKLTQNSAINLKVQPYKI